MSASKANMQRRIELYETVLRRFVAKSSDPVTAEEALATLEEAYSEGFPLRPSDLDAFLDGMAIARDLDKAEGSDELVLDEATDELVIHDEGPEPETEPTETHTIL